jgi:hypothetical protein
MAPPENTKLLSTAEAFGLMFVPNRMFTNFCGAAASTAGTVVTVT